ncbi:MAG: response regulator [Actinomycetes bacterium]
MILGVWGRIVVEGRVLVVEDNERSLKLACDVLQMRGFETIGARTGAEAVVIAASQQPALVLLDVALPDMDGVETLQALRANPRTATIPVVAVTAFAMKGDRERLLASGFDGYVSKPIDVATFVDDVAAHINAPS